MKILYAIHSIDLRTFNWFLERKYRASFVQMSRLVSRSADGPLYLIISCFLVVLNNWLLIKVLFIGFTIERISYFILKNKLKRNRPQQTIPGFISVIQPSDQFSFPSGHTSAAFLVMGLVMTFYPALTIALLLWAFSVGLSRVVLGVHFPTDSVAGALLGYSISQLCLTLFT